MVVGSELKEGVALCITDGLDEGASLGLLEGASLGAKILLGMFDGEVLGMELG